MVSGDHHESGQWAESDGAVTSDHSDQSPGLMCSDRDTGLGGAGASATEPPAHKSLSSEAARAPQC